MAKMAQSAAVAAKSERLYETVRYNGRGRFTVAGTKADHTVQMSRPADFDPTGWQCDCDWSKNGGQLCSHVRAAVNWALDAAYGDGASLAVAA